MFVPDSIKQIAEKMQDFGFEIFIVGGAVRDHFMGIKPEDFDIVTDATMAACEQVFDGFVAAHPKAPVFKTQIDGEVTEVAFTRGERSTGIGKDAFVFDTGVSIEEDCVRRDTTINAIAFSVTRGVFIDPCDGIGDIERRVIRHCSAAFEESEERVFRVFAQRVRFGHMGFKVHPTTEEICKRMVESGKTDIVSTDQIFRQGFFKAFKRGTDFVGGMAFMHRIGAIDRHFPTIAAMMRTPQDARFHPEGDAMTHSIMATQIAADMGGSTIQRMGAFFHDFGKIGFTVIHDDGSITSAKHDSKAAMKFVERGMAEIGIREAAMCKAIIGMARMHMRRPTTSKGKVRFARDCDSFGISARDAVMVMIADHMARGSASEDITDEVMPIVDFIESKVQVEPIIMGRHVIAMGVKPGPMVGEIMREAFQAQVDGIITDMESGIEFVKACIE